jgi:hypothetical protein
MRDKALTRKKKSGKRRKKDDDMISDEELADKLQGWLEVNLSSLLYIYRLTQYP